MKILTLKIPALRVWHLIGIVATVAAFLTVFRYCGEVFTRSP